MSTRHPDVIVIGAGVIGLFTAWALVDAGLKVLVIERGEIGRESSWAGGGILSPLHPWQSPEAVLALSRWSQSAYPDIAGHLVESTGIDPEWTRGGLLVQEPHSVIAASSWAQQESVAVEVLGIGAQKERFKNIEPVESAFLLPSVAQIRNPRLLKALAALLRAKGVELQTGVTVVQVVVGQGRVCGVQTTQQRIPAGRVVIAAGAWSGTIGPLTLPIKPIKGQMLLYAASPVSLPVMVLRDGIYLIPRRDGRILVGSSVEDGGYDKTPTDTIKQFLHMQACALFPALADARLEQHWAGLRPGSREGVPLISEVPTIEGLYINTGHTRHGLLTAPASARLLLDLLLKREPLIEPGCYTLH